METTFLDERLLAQEYRDQVVADALPIGPLRGTVSADPGSINAQTLGSVDVTVNGVAVGDIVLMNPPDALNAGLAFAGCRVISANTVRIYIANITGGAIDDGSNTWDFLWFDLT